MSAYLYPREYFAAHAPAEVPTWFVAPPDKRTKNPTPPAYPAEIARIAEEWDRDDGGVDLESFVDMAYGGDPPQSCIDLAWQYQNAKSDYDNARFAQIEQAKAHRFFAWRWYYADMMLAYSLAYSGEEKTS